MILVPAGMGRHAVVPCPRCDESITPDDELEYAPSFDNSRRECPSCGFEVWVEGDGAGPQNGGGHA